MDKPERTDLGVPTPTLTAAVEARTISALKAERVAASKILSAPAMYTFNGERAAFVEAVRRALYCSKVASYAQGMALLSAASREYAYAIPLARTAAIWRAGCIIRARFLADITEAYEAEPHLANLMLAPKFRAALSAYQAEWRDVVTTAIRAGVPTPAFSASLAYYDSYRSERLPANLIQAQRDLFGAHTFERTDREGTFHANWSV